MMTNTAVSHDDSTLVAALVERDIRQLYLSAYRSDVAQITAPILIGALASNASPRLREALISLFLRHPDYAVYVPTVIVDLDESSSLVLRHMYTTAVYLQRFWHTTLSLYLGQFPFLPDYFGQSYFQLPPPDAQFGESGLRALAELFQRQTGLDWLSVYSSTISLFLTQLSLETSYASQPS